MSAKTAKHTTVHRIAGVTLIELMVVLAVLIIMTSIAYPLYTQQVSKASRSEARVALNLLAAAEQRFYTLNGRYGSAAELGVEYTTAVSGLSDRDGDGSFDNYALAVVATTTSFTITADTIGQQDSADTDCNTLSLNNLGIASATAKPGGNENRCW